MMFTAGLPEILGGWLDPSTQAVKGHVLNQFFVKDRDALLAPYAVQVHSLWLWEIPDWITILFETGFLIAVWRARWFKLFLIIAVFFHFTTQLLMNISFLPNFLAYSAFLNWDRINQEIYQIFNQLRNEYSENIPVWLAGLMLTVFFLLLKWLSYLDFVLADSELMLYEVVFLT